MLAAEVIQSAEKRVGQTIGGKWHLDRVIGVGGMAAVYEATHRNRNRVAIKLLHPPLSLDEGTRSRFLREGYVANTIRHSGAVQILDDDTTEDGIAFLVMELLRGESVEERMLRKGGALDMVEALSICDQLLDVLGAAHDQHVVHRDVKPDNLFLTEDGRLKVLDFGIARLHQGDTGATKVGSFMGTPAFCAPEQARGRWDEVDHRTDLFSVGASLFTCLSGAHVHEAETSSEQLALAISASARSLRAVLPSAPDELVELVDMALSYEKEERFQSARAMRAAVQRVMAGLPQGAVGRKLGPPPALGAAVRSVELQTELEPESYPPAVLPTKGGVRAVLLALLAAGALALILLAVARSPETPLHRSSTLSPSSQVEKLSSRAQDDEENVQTPPPGSTAQTRFSPLVGPPHHEDAAITESAPGRPARALTTPRLASPGTRPSLDSSTSDSDPGSALSPPKERSAPRPAAVENEEELFIDRF